MAPSTTETILFDYLAQFIILSDEEKKALLELNLFKTYKKNTILLKEGRLSNEGYFVIKGCIRCYYIVEGEEKNTAFYTEAESHTPACVVHQKPSEYYVACVEDCILLASTPKMEAVIFEKFPRFETLCRVMTEKMLSENQTSFDDFRISSPERRYLSLLKNRPDLLQRVPQYQMASYLGMTPQSLSRMRQRLVKKPS